MEPVIRRGTAADAAFLAWVMLMASRSHGPRGTWDLVVGGDDDECLEYLRRLALVPGTLCHCESFVIAEIEGQPVAALATCRFADGGWAAVGQAMAKVETTWDGARPMWRHRGRDWPRFWPACPQTLARTGASSLSQRFRNIVGEGWLTG